MTNSTFELLVPCGHPTPYRIEGAVGGTPDIALLRSSESCWRATLPPFLENLTFHFAGVPRYENARVQSFYHLGAFFVVSDSVKSFIEKHAGCDFQVERIRTKHPENAAIEPYWAMKVRTTIDCIVPDQSHAKRPSWSSEPPQTFAELAMEVKLSGDVSPFFANKGVDTYFAYPSTGVQDVSMNFSNVPSGTKLFQPTYWPQYLVVDKAFSKDLERQCRGGTLGYYFWTLPFQDVSNQYGKTMQALR
jgi:hypothetical protein